MSQEIGYKPAAAEIARFHRALRDEGLPRDVCARVVAAFAAAHIATSLAPDPHAILERLVNIQHGEE